MHLTHSMMAMMLETVTAHLFVPQWQITVFCCQRGDRPAWLRVPDCSDDVREGDSVDFVTDCDKVGFNYRKNVRNEHWAKLKVHCARNFGQDLVASSPRRQLHKNTYFGQGSYCFGMAR